MALQIEMQDSRIYQVLSYTYNVSLDTSRACHINGGTNSKSIWFLLRINLLKARVKIWAQSDY